MTLSKTFQPAELAGMTLRNRWVRSATYEGNADDDGHVTPELIRTMTELADGGVGLIVSGHTYVSPEGQAGAHQLTVKDDASFPRLTSMAQAVHDHGGKIVLQLAHAGGMAAVTDPRGPSAFPAARTGRVSRAMTPAEIAALPEVYAAAAGRAQKAGFDGVQLHAAHGYLLSQFLSPHFNHRDDEYGGSLDNRSRLLLDILAAVRTGVGPDYPVLIKINSQDFLDDGWSEDELLALLDPLEAHGLSALEISGGTFVSENNRGPSRRGPLTGQGEAYFRTTAAKVKARTKLPVILVGGIRTPAVAETLLTSGAADFFSMSRPLIREPGLVNRWAAGDLSSAACVSCNLCFRPVLQRQAVYCLAAAKTK